MNTFRLLVEIITGCGILIGAIASFIKVIHNFAEGQKCLLRAEMLRIYYKYQEKKKVPEYELENFWKSYNAYKSLRGNSFISDVADEVHTWSVAPR